MFVLSRTTSTTGRSARRGPRRLIAAVALAASASLVLSACSSGDSSDSGGGSSGGSSKSIDAKADPVPDLKKDDAAAAMVPAEVASKGTLKVGSDTTYPPNEYVDADGKTIVGMDVDLGKAIGTKLGLKVEFETAPFDTLLAALGTKYDLGISSFTDNKQREAQVDFVTYYQAGTVWAVKKGTKLDPDASCGKKVAVQTGTVQETDDLPARQEKCQADGKDPIEVQKYADQGDATTAVVTGKAEAMLADLPVVLDAIGKTGGQLEQAGKQYDAAPYGIAVPKNGGTLKDAILAAMKSLIADGSYTKILTKWNAEVGAIKEPVINGATG